jgi:hypothetical protein
LADWSRSGREDTAEYSDKFKEAIQKIIKEHDLDEDSIFEQIRSTCVTRRDGVVERITSEGDILWELVETVEYNELPAVIALHDR